MSIPFPVRIQAAVVRAAYALPQGLRRAFAGKAEVRDGQTLALDAQVILKFQRMSKATMVMPGGVGPSRDEMEYARYLVGGRTIASVAVRDVGIPQEQGELAARLYTPGGVGKGSGLLVYVHGGGWVVGSLESHDHVARFLAERGRVRVLSVGYRLAPEHVFPAGLEDVQAALDYAFAKAVDLGADPERIAIGGDSAGGNLAAVTVQQAVRRGGPVPVFQLLLYPVTDLSTKRDSHRHFAETYFLTSDNMDWFADRYAPEPVDRTDPRISPLLAEDLAGLPPTYLSTAGFDPLRDEGEAYAQALREAGVDVYLSRQSDLIHGYANYIGVGHRFEEATAEAAEALRKAVGA
ncbi:alpha/beta hydrolase [Kitasatospora sp. NPDC096128]|uniref:alpha/beta hydrolase n=1 Tax=Kitasatospora sp. NPDC096128 TaxID=3155547 RepID=UPI00332BE7B8